MVAIIAWQLGGCRRLAVGEGLFGSEFAIPDLNLIKQEKQAVTFRKYSSVGVLAVAVFAAGNGYVQVAPGMGQVATLGSGIEKSGDTGVRASANIQILAGRTKGIW